ncbi:MAG: CotH kinase family protein [Oscillospiraceae bacterium]|nr:CotH kinase family protein [Oscillospiraceae bacterium]
MSASKHIDKICAAVTAVVLVLTLLFMNGSSLGITAVSREMGYESRIFDTSRVHTIDIVMDGWEDFIETCENEEYANCTVIIDGEAYKNTAIRAKGNTSLRNVSEMDSDRYSFKIEFDHYDSTRTYYGLDKLCLNNIIQDNTYMKDYLAYRLMAEQGAAAPLCSYAYITVNGEDFGLYLAVEGVEESFLQRNFGSDYGNLYKPDSSDMGGGRGNGKDFDMEKVMPQENNVSDFTDRTNFAPADRSQMKQQFGGKGGGMGSDDVKLKYIDDDPESYPNIFDSAKTDIDDSDKARLISSLKSLSENENIEQVVDIEEVIDYFAVHNFLCNGDSYTGSIVHNYYLYEKDGVMSMIPWDYNLAFGTFQGGNASQQVNFPIDSPVSSGDVSDRPMVSWIFESEEYTEQYHSSLARLVENTDFLAMIEATAALIDKYVEKDPTKFCTYEEFQKGVTAISEFCRLRAESVKGQLAGTIPSTSEGQSADSSALIDCSSLNMSDMGNMGSGGGGKGGFGNMGERPDFAGGGFQRPNGGNMPENGDFQPPSGGNMPQKGDFRSPSGGDMTENVQPSDGENMPEKGNSRQPGTESVQPAQAQLKTDSSGGIILAVSAVVLLAGILFSVKIKR